MTSRVLPSTTIETSLLVLSTDTLRFTSSSP